MAEKNANIEAAQERKSDSIKIAACARDATLLTVATMSKDIHTEEMFKETWLKWRVWLSDNFGDEIPF